MRDAGAERAAGRLGRADRSELLMFATVLESQLGQIRSEISATTFLPPTSHSCETVLSERPDRRVIGTARLGTMVI